jgi:hypothetical protein
LEQVPSRKAACKKNSVEALAHQLTLDAFLRMRESSLAGRRSFFADKSGKLTAPEMRPKMFIIHGKH